ncbi:MAG: alcohol dehydrogenase catalytic domain-containing protein [Saprospiraceae bacterium]|nr:alcohol dehydrogenase catalytic domain-containing protein [Saprospiraceae bacterium]
MQGAYYYGDKTFKIGECRPTAPGDDEVRLDVAFCGVCGTDVHIYHGVMDKRIGPPQIIGHEASAVVSEIGSAVENVKVGDRVSIRPLRFGAQHPFDKGNPHIGKHLQFIGIDSPGAFQQSWTVPGYTCHHLPETLSLELGALIEPLAVACHDVRRGRVRSGERVLVMGGGPIGVLIAFVLREKGASVMVSEVNEARLQMLKKWNFETVNPITENLVDRVSAFTKGAMVDAVFEVSGSAAAAKSMTDLLCARGRIIMVAIHGNGPQPIDLFKFFWSELELIGARLYEEEDYEEAIALADAGNIPLQELITSIRSLSEIQGVFEEIDDNPDGLKYLINCQE